MTLLTACFAVALAAIHLFVGRLRFLDCIPRSIWLSAAGGVAVAYVFLHILPDLAAHQATLSTALGLPRGLADVTIFAVGLAGLTAFYGLERFALGSRTTGTGEVHVFWIHVGSFALYNVLIGYLLVHPEEPGLTSSVIFFIAMAMHFVTNDFGLRDHHRQRYDRFGRWLMAVAVLAGWALGRLEDLPDLAIALLFAFLAGGVMLNVLKEELPQERQSRFLPFLLAAAAYAAILIALDVT